MKFPNAYAGVKKLYTSEILTIIALVFALITVFAGFFAIGVIEEGVEGAVDPSLVATGAFTIITAILSLIAFILSLVGLGQAGKDEPNFKYALWATFLGIVASVASGFVPEGFGRELLSFVNEMAMLLVPLLSISGIMSLAKKTMNSDMEQRGNSLFKLITAGIIVAGVAGIIYHFFAEGAVVLGIIAIVIDIIVSLMYLGYLNRARKMLAK